MNSISKLDVSDWRRMNYSIKNCSLLSRPQFVTSNWICMNFSLLFLNQIEFVVAIYEVRLAWGIIPWFCLFKRTNDEKVFAVEKEDKSFRSWVICLNLIQRYSFCAFWCALWKVFSFLSMAVWKCENHRNTKTFRRSHEKWGAKRSKTWQLFFMTFLSSLATPFKEHFCAECSVVCWW